MQENEELSLLLRALDGAGPLLLERERFESFDGAPPQEDQKRNDAGISITLGWSF